MDDPKNGQAIRDQAYLMWVERGQPLWDDWRDWFEAQSFVRGEWKPGWREIISAIAYRKWCQEGCPEGRSLEFWTAAEREVGGGE
jgi:hypothetical protein